MFDKQFDVESIQEYLDAWRNPAVSARLEITPDYAAYQLLVHAGLLKRQEGPNVCELPACLAEMPSGERVSLVRSACALLAGFSFPDYYHDLFARDDLDLDEFAEASELLMQRDEWDAALWMAGKLINDQLETDEALLCDLALAHSVAAAFDEELFKHPDIVGGALYILDDGPEIQRIGPWFQRAKELERQFNDPTLADVLAAAAHGVSTDTSQSRRLSDLLLLPNGDAGVQQVEDHYQLAASSGSTAEALSEQRELLETRRRVDGDEEVGVVFWRDENARQCKEWRVELDGAPENRKQYISVEIRFNGGDVRSKPFCFDVATFELEPADWQSEITATLIDQQGERRRVLLGEYRNGGR